MTRVTKPEAPTPSEPPPCSHGPWHRCVNVDGELFAFDCRCGSVRIPVDVDGWPQRLMGQGSPTEAVRLRAAIEAMIEASDNGGGSASDAIQDMLGIAEDALGGVAVEPPAPTSDGPPITSVDWSALCGTAPPGHPEHWAFVHLAVAINHLGAALRMAGVDPNAHATETTVPNEDRANLQEVFCAWKCAKAMVKEIERLARHRTSSAPPKEEP